MNKFPKRKRIRLKEYDYSQPGYYYITICTQNRECLFGNIENDGMVLNRFGMIAQDSWRDLPNHHKNIYLDAYVIMPNHIHGIIITGCPVGNGPARSVIKNNNVSVVIGSYKSTVAKQIIFLYKYRLKWQKSFYDHIIHTTDSLNHIREYIAYNPITWDNDENYSLNYKVTVQACLNSTG